VTVLLVTAFIVLGLTAVTFRSLSFAEKLTLGDATDEGLDTRCFELRPTYQERCVLHLGHEGPHKIMIGKEERWWRR